MRATTLLACFVLATMAGLAGAQVRPQPGSGDPRLQSIEYRADQVVQITGAPGYQVTIALAPDENIQSIALGDSSAWQATPTHSGDHLVVKPLVSGINTNMTVVTDSRTYAFDLISMDGPSSDLAYTVSFRYLKQSAAPAVAPAPGTRIGIYRVSGDRSLRPTKIVDDGNHTYIDWRPDLALPVVYALDVAKNETLLNGAMRGETYVVDSVGAHLVFRIDKRVARADRIISRQPRR